QHALIERKINRRQRPAGRWRSLEGLHDDPRETDARGASDEREQKAFDEELTHDARAAGTDRQSYGKFASSSCGLREKQIRDVATANQQHCANDPAEEQRDRYHLLS